MHAIFADALTKLFISFTYRIVNIPEHWSVHYTSLKSVPWDYLSTKQSNAFDYSRLPPFNVSCMYWNCHSTDEQTSKALGGCVQIVIRTSSDGSHSLTKRPISASYLQSLRFLRNLELLSLHLNCLPTTMAFKYAKYNFSPFIHTYGCTIIIG